LIVATVATEALEADSVRATCLVTAATPGDAADRVAVVAREASAVLELLAASERTKLRRRSTLAAASLAAASTRRTTRVATSEATLGLAAVRVALIARVTNAALDPPTARTTDARLASEVALEEDAASVTSLDLAV
jgi:hypothetical protein